MSQKEKPCAIYGGQAVIEGVMFGGQSVNVTAVRRKDNSIEYLEVPKTELGWVRPLKKIPFIRGIVGIVEASAKGAQHLNFSAEAFAEEEGDGAPKKEKKESAAGRISMILGVAVVGILSFIFGKFIFTLVPPIIEQLLFSKLFENQIGHNLVEGLIKIVLLIGYIYFISLTPMIKRLFQYHGAEHKVISAYEAGVDLTVENVQKFSTLHYRCGSSFIVFTVLVGVVIYSFFTYDSFVERIVQRIVLLPVVIGVSYEVLRFTNSLREVPVLRYLGYPGLWLQMLTTKQPDNSMVEVSIASFNRMRELDEQARA
ncbi:DUF1385 domain-containing protein [Paenibacillus sp. UNC451MF]|uniref:DUF1385 domain-containing protein n=1 Tax=Paenibacillus sp. UNC451MF TaxID=1449063 RepID=UPI0004911E41|nr:DUF1385 domain-containing protein [Paenibacillus sp. UNC451MF]